MRYALAAMILSATFSPAVAAPYDGSWAPTSKECTSPTDGNLRIVGGKYYEHEAICAINKADGYEGTYALFLSCSGEGETWKKVVTLSPSGQRMKIGSVGERTVVRCR